MHALGALLLLTAGCAAAPAPHATKAEAPPAAQPNYEAAVQACQERHKQAQDALLSTNQPLVEPDPSFTACMEQAKAGLDRETRPSP